MRRSGSAADRSAAFLPLRLSGYKILHALLRAGCENDSAFARRFRWREVPNAACALIWAHTCPHISDVHGIENKTFGEEMTNSTRQQIEGDLHDAKGTAKEAEGKLTHDPDLEAEGRTEKVAGIVQKKLGKLEKLFANKSP